MSRLVVYLLATGAGAAVFWLVYSTLQRYQAGNQADGPGIGTTVVMMIGGTIAAIILLGGLQYLGLLG